MRLDEWSDLPSGGDDHFAAHDPRQARSGGPNGRQRPSARVLSSRQRIGAWIVTLPATPRRAGGQRIDLGGEGGGRPRRLSE
jgi:hypothetical protein